MRSGRCSEFFRKLLHTSAVLILPIFQFLSRFEIIAYGLILLIIFFFLEFLRFRYDFLDIIARDREKNQLAAHIHLLTSIILSVFLFPEAVAATGIVMAVVGDSFAAIIGSNYGETFIQDNKTWEGFFGGVFFSLLSGFLVSVFFYDISIPVLIAVSFFVGFPDIMDLKIDDNLILPILMSFMIFLMA